MKPPVIRVEVSVEGRGEVLALRDLACDVSYDIVSGSVKLVTKQPTVIRLVADSKELLIEHVYLRVALLEESPRLVALLEESPPLWVDVNAPGLPLIVAAGEEATISLPTDVAFLQGHLEGYAASLSEDELHAMRLRERVREVRTS